MLSHAFRQGGLINGLWWWILPPGVCLVMVSLSLVLIGFYLEENAAGSAAPTTAWRRK
jgi:peptide/nickel transport system permease protein